MNTWQTCLACEIITGRRPAPGGEIYADTYWVVTLGLTLLKRGWVVVCARNHRSAFTDLTAEEYASLGTVLWRVQVAMQQELSPAAIYTCAFHEEVPHLHFHLIPRYGWDELRGPALVSAMFERQQPDIGQDDADLLAERLRIACADLRPAPSHLPPPPRMPRDQSPTAPQIPHPAAPETAKMRYAVEDDD